MSPPKPIHTSLVVALGTAAILCSSSAVAQAPANADVTPPTVVQHVDPVYPPSALSERQHADVVLAVTVDVDGHVSKVDVIESGGANLDEAAIVAAREWTFVPAMRRGKPIASRIKVPFHFAPPAPAPELVETPKGPGDVAMHEAVQVAPPSGPAGPSPQEQTEEVRVAGRRRPPSRGDGITPLPWDSSAQSCPPRTPPTSWKLAPGVLVARRGGEGHADSIVLREFDAPARSEAMEFLGRRGAHINDPGHFHGNGYADTHFILPEVVESLRVIEGPFDPHQGNFAVAGSADYELGLAHRGLTAKQTVGSFGTDRTLLTWSPEDESPHTFAAAEYAQSSGFGENRAYHRGSAIAQYEGKFGERGVWRVTGQAYSVVAQAAGVVREDDYEAGPDWLFPRDSYDPNQGQDASRLLGGGGSRDARR